MYEIILSLLLLNDIWLFIVLILMLIGFLIIFFNISD